MIRGLYRRLALILLLVFVILGTLFFWLYERSSERLQHEISQKLHLHLAQYLVQDITLFDNGELNHEKMKEAFSKVMMLDPGTELYIIDPQGRVVAYEAPEEKIRHRIISLAPIQQFLDDTRVLPILGDDPRSEKQKTFSVAPIYASQEDLSETTTGQSAERKLLGYLYIIINGEVYDDVTMALKANKAWWVSLGMMAAAMIFLLLTAFLLFNKLTQPLVKLSREVKRFEDSGFTELPEGAQQLLSSPSEQYDEFQQLCGSFYRMAQHIIDQLGSLKKHNELRSEFLAHVSHDLRTPLAGVRAYLETLQLKGQEINESARQEYLEKALVTNNRLSQMIDELFELARLEYGEIDIHPETIRVSDLLSDMYANLSTLATEKHIHLQVKLQREALTVYADVARLDRILQNLIANAIQYTPHKGEVTVTVEPLGNEEVKLSVADTGQGIAEADLPYIFEPYFRSRSGRRAYQGGKGLGLAITERLLALHGSQLEVNSRAGQGTVFSFILKAKAPTETGD